MKPKGQHQCLLLPPALHQGWTHILVHSCEDARVELFKQVSHMIELHIFVKRLISHHRVIVPCLHLRVSMIMIMTTERVHRKDLCHILSRSWQSVPTLIRIQATPFLHYVDFDVSLSMGCGQRCRPGFSLHERHTLMFQKGNGIMQACSFTTCFPGDRL